MNSWAVWKMARVRNHLVTALNVAREADLLTYEMFDEYWYTCGLQFVRNHGEVLCQEVA
jgi:hypothetical protein